MYHEYDLQQQLEAVKLEHLKLKYEVLIAEMSFTIKALFAHELEEQLADYAAKAGFNSNQPRVPCGQAGGGQWTQVDGYRGNSTPKSWGLAHTLKDHFLDHGKDFKAVSPLDYANKANEFLKKAIRNNFPSFEYPGGKRIAIYEPKTNTFAVYNRNGTTATFYKPLEGKSYFEKLTDRQINRGGRIINSFSGGGGANPFGSLNIFHPLNE